MQKLATEVEKLSGLPLGLQGPVSDSQISPSRDENIGQSVSCCQAVLQEILEFLQVIKADSKR